MHVGVYHHRTAEIDILDSFCHLMQQKPSSFHIRNRYHHIATDCSAIRFTL